MSSSSTIVLLVPILDGTNHYQWAIAIKAYLQVQELWAITGGSEVTPMLPTAPNTAAATKILAAYKAELAEHNVKFETWSLKNDKAYGTILLYLSATIQATHSVYSAQKLWSELETEFNKPHNMTIFSDFRYCLDYCLPGNTDPVPDILRIEDHFNYLSNQQCTIPELIKGMILLNALPSKWHSVTEIYLQGNNEVGDIKFATVKYAITNWWAQEQRGPYSINKLSAIKQKPGTPHFKQQQQQYTNPSHSDKPFQ